MSRVSEYRKDSVQALYEAGFPNLVVCAVGEVEARDDRIAELEAALNQRQQESEPAGYVHEFVSQFSGAPVWRHSAAEWNGQWPKSSRPYFFHPPKPAAPPQVPDGIAEKYNELLYHVARKFPNESRHETALRYIKNAESAEDACSAAKEEGE